jgi:hypothetical protein
MLSMKMIISSAFTKIWSYQRQCLFIAATAYQQMEDIEDDECDVLWACKNDVDIYLIPFPRTLSWRTGIAHTLVKDKSIYNVIY